eukprot:6368833-Prymnesium_polylepis.1
MATLLAYLTDDFDGGETEFGHRDFKLKPPIGAAAPRHRRGQSPRLARAPGAGPSARARDAFSSLAAVPHRARRTAHERDAGASRYSRASERPRCAQCRSPYGVAGSALVFYNFKGGRCNPAASHRANVVRRGSKEVLQRWYSYPEQPFLAARGFREPGDGMLPYQPMIVCDWTHTGWTNVSCRWYNSHHAIAPEVVRAGGDSQIE